MEIKIGEGKLIKYHLPSYNLTIHISEKYMYYPRRSELEAFLAKLKPVKLPKVEKGNITFHNVTVVPKAEGLSAFGTFRIEETIIDYEYADIKCELKPVDSPLLEGINDIIKPHIPPEKAVRELKDDEIMGINAVQPKHTVSPTICFCDSRKRYYVGIMRGHWSNWVGQKFQVLEKEDGIITKIRYYP